MMHTLVLTTIHLQTKFKMSRFTRCNDNGAAQNLQMGHVTLTTPHPFRMV